MMTMFYVDLLSPILFKVILPGLHFITMKYR